MYLPLSFSLILPISVTHFAALLMVSLCISMPKLSKRSRITNFNKIWVFYYVIRLGNSYSWPLLMSSEWQDNGGSSFAVLPWHNLVILCKFFPHFPRFFVCSNHRNRRHSLDGAPGASTGVECCRGRGEVWWEGKVKGDGCHYAVPYSISLASPVWRIWP